MANAVRAQSDTKAWESCYYCSQQTFKAPQDFERHLREQHSTKEGGSLVCRYGHNGVCAALLLDGAARDYEAHVRRHHATAAPARDRPWGVYSAAQNLPAALNDPRHPKQHNFFTATWGDAFVENDRSAIPPSPYLPEVTIAHIETYLRKVGKKLRRHRRLANLDGAPPLPILTDSNPLQDIPSVFFKPNLQLNDPATFDTVFPELSKSPEDTRAPCRLLQEKLSHYLDAVEIQIADQVARKSDAFFHAMMSHDTIMEQMSNAVSLVKNLRSDMAHTKSGLAAGPLQLVRLARLKENANKTHNKLKLIATVHQTQPTIQLLLSTADYVTALDLIGSTQAILSAELAGVHAFRHLSSQLNEMERLIDKMLNTEFQRFVAADLNRPPGDDSPSPDEDKLISVISGLLRRKDFQFMETYREEAVTTVQATVKQAMIEEVTGGEPSDEGEVAVRGTGEGAGWRGAGAAQLLARAAPRLLALLQRVLALRRLVLRAALAADVALLDGEDFFSAEEQQMVQDKLQALVNAICDYCLERCSTLIMSTDKDKTIINGEQMGKLSLIVEDFTAKCEEISGRSCPTLKNALKNQAMRYIQRFHNERRNKLTLLLDNERWKQAEVPAEFQYIVDHISKTGLFPEAPSEAESDRPPSSFLTVESEPFAVVGVILLALRLVGEYCRAGREAGYGAAGRALAELLRLLNSRTCQLVLGAGALQSSGLKTITATNLALASRALQLLLWALTPIRNHFTKAESVDTLTQAFDVVEKDIVSHIREIENKLSGIVGGLVSSQLNTWEARPPVPSQQFRSISRHLLKLHEALAGVLPSAQLCVVYQTVHRNFKDKLRDQLSRMNIVGNGGPQHGVVTSELTFYLQTLVTLQVLPEEELNLKCMDEIWLK